MASKDPLGLLCALKFDGVNNRYPKQRLTSPQSSNLDTEKWLVGRMLVPSKNTAALRDSCLKPAGSLTTITNTDCI